MIMEL
jgi:hypothetical protein